MAPTRCKRPSRLANPFLGSRGTQLQTHVIFDRILNQNRGLWKEAAREIGRHTPVWVCHTGALQMPGVCSLQFTVSPVRVPFRPFKLPCSGLHTRSCHGAPAMRKAPTDLPRAVRHSVWFAAPIQPACLVGVSLCIAALASSNQHHERCCKCIL